MNQSIPMQDHADWDYVSHVKVDRTGIEFIGKINKHTNTQHLMLVQIGGVLMLPSVVIFKICFSKWLRITATWYFLTAAKSCVLQVVLICWQPDRQVREPAYIDICILL